jgi:hypothetical protein
MKAMYLHVAIIVGVLFLLESKSKKQGVVKAAGTRMGQLKEDRNAW